MPPYRNPVEARRKKDRPVQKVADQNCYMSSADFKEKHHSTDQGHSRDGQAPARRVLERQTSAATPSKQRS
jgi:hypothetical protein